MSIEDYNALKYEIDKLRLRMDSMEKVTNCLSGLSQSVTILSERMRLVLWVLAIHTISVVGGLVTLFFRVISG
jgi:hypothetical protein